MSRVTRSAQADEDLIAIWLMIAAENPAAADRVLDRMDDVCDMLAHYPAAGPARDDIAPSLRYFPAPPYLVLYRIVTEEHVDIVRVVDGRRDLSSLF
jgi:toxin ParE1/3/4